MINYDYRIITTATQFTFLFSKWVKLPNIGAAMIADSRFALTIMVVAG